MLAITGTDGKTTTTLLAVEMLRAGGLRTIDAGNTDTPLVDAIALDLDAFVVEATSFRLAWTPSFRAEGAAWLNLAPDHLNWHRSMSSYELAKAQVYANQRPDDVAVGFVDDETVMRRLDVAPGRHVTFGASGADYHVAGGSLRRAGEATSLRSRRCAAACPTTSPTRWPRPRWCWRPGSSIDAAVAAALATFTGPPHRLEHVGTWNDVAWFNDSKATTPHAAGAAIRSFDHIVLIAGGYDKHVDLSPMAVDRSHVDAVIALGATAPAIVAAFDGVARLRCRRRHGRRRRAGTDHRPSRDPRCCCRRGAPASISTATSSTGASTSERSSRTSPTRSTHVQHLDRCRPASSGTRTPPRERAPARVDRHASPTSVGRVRPVGRRSAPRVAATREVLGPPPGTYYAIAGVVTVLVMLGLVMVLSASAVTEANLGHSPYRVFAKQAMWAAIGLVGLVIVARIPYRSWRRFGDPARAVVGCGHGGAVRSRHRCQRQRGPLLGASRSAQRPAVGVPQTRGGRAGRRPAHPPT